MKTLWIILVSSVGWCASFTPVLAREPENNSGAKARMSSADPVGKASRDDFVSIKDFGAIGNNANDDGPAIRKAVAYGVEHGKGIYFPGGTYKIASLSDGSTTYKGASQHKHCVVVNNASATPQTLHISGDNATLVTSIYPSNVSGSSQLNLLSIEGNFRDVMIEGITFQSKHPNLKTTTVGEANYYGKIFGINLFWENYPSKKYFPRDVTITNCVFIDHTIDINVWAAQNLLIEGNTFRSSWGLASSGRADWSVGIGIRGTSRGIRVSGNYFSGCDADDISGLLLKDKFCRDGFIISQGGASEIIVSGNNIRRHTYEGIYIGSGSTSWFPEDGSVITGNTVNGDYPKGASVKYNYGIRCDRKNSVISNNVIRNASSGIMLSTGGPKPSYETGDNASFTTIIGNVIQLTPFSHVNASAGVGMAFTYGVTGVNITGNTISGYDINAFDQHGWDGTAGKGRGGDPSIPRGMQFAGACSNILISNNMLINQSKHGATLCTAFTFDNSTNLEFLGNKVVGWDYLFAKQGGAACSVVAHGNSFDGSRLFEGYSIVDYGKSEVTFKKPVTEQ